MVLVMFWFGSGRVGIGLAHLCDIWSERCSKRAGRCPEAGEGQDTLSVLICVFVVVSQWSCGNRGVADGGLVHPDNYLEGKEKKKKKTYLPHSRIALDTPKRTATRFPNELSATRKFNPLTAPESPKTLIKNKLAAVNFAWASSCFGTAAK